MMYKCNPHNTKINYLFIKNIDYFPGYVICVEVMFKAFIVKIKQGSSKN